MEPDPWLILDSGMKSPAHRTVILRTCFRDLGAGAVGCDGYGEYRLDADGLQAYPRQIGFTFAERDVSGRLSFAPRSVLETDDMLKDAKVPHWLEGAIGRTYAQPVYLRLDSTYEGEIRFGEEVVPISGDTISEYMVFTLRRGQEPDDSVYLHALHPPKLARLHGEG